MFFLLSLTIWQLYQVLTMQNKILHMEAMISLQNDALLKIKLSS